MKMDFDKRYCAMALVALLLACGGGGSSDTSSSAASSTNSADTTPAPNTTPIISSSTSQRWSDPATWGGTLPKAGDKISIPAGQTIVLDVATPALAGLLIEGTLVADDAKDIAITSDWIIAYGKQAKFQIGSSSQPYTRKAVITLTGKDAAENVLGLGLGNKVLGATGGGTLALYGESGRSTWTKLKATAKAGASAIDVVDATGWRVGDRIMLTSTSFNAADVSEHSIAAISGNTISLDQPLKREHLCVSNTVADVRIDQCGEVGLLTRNIVVKGDDSSAASNTGAHVMVMSGSAYVNGVEFTQVGQLGRKGRYGFHWHLTGDASGQFLTNSAIHRAFHKGMAIHGADNTRVAGNVIYNTVGHNMMWAEDGVEKNNVIENNLAAWARPVPKASRIDDAADDLPSNYWGRSPSNILRGNVAAGADGGMGFWYDTRDNGGRPTGNFADCTTCLSTAGQTFGMRDGSTPNDPANQMPFGEFKNNTAHSSNRAANGNGDRDFLGGSGLLVADYNPEVESKIARFENFSGYWNVMGAWVDATYAAFVPRIPYYSVQMIGMKLADNATGVRSNGGLVKDSVIVGLLSKSTIESVNLNYYVQQGLEWHHNPASYENVAFVNFKPFNNGGRTIPAGMIGIPDTENASHWVASMKGMRLINANYSALRPYYQPEIEKWRDIVFENPDGSLFGSGQVESIVYDNPLLLASNCTSLGDSMSRCPNARFIPLFLGDDTNKTDYGIVTLTRLSDGNTNTMKTFGVGVYNAFGSVRASTTYEVKANQPITYMSIKVGHEDPRGQWVGLVFPFSGTLDTEDGGTVFTSLNAFNASTEQGYFLDRSASKVYVRVRDWMKICKDKCS